MKQKELFKYWKAELYRKNKVLPLGIILAVAGQTISSGAFSDKDKENLELADGTNALIAERIIKDRNNEIIEMEKAFYRSDLYTFKLNLSRKFG